MKSSRMLGLAIGWGMAAGICYLSLSAPPQTGIDFAHQDKWGHLLAYGILTGWFCLLYRRRATQWRYGLGFALMGIAIEGLQTLLPAREGSWLDAAANFTGVILALWLASFFWSRR